MFKKAQFFRTTLGGHTWSTKNTSNPTFFVLSLQWICCMFPLPLVPYRGKSVYLCIFDRLIKQKHQKRLLCVVYQKRVVSKICSQLSCGTLHVDRHLTRNLWHVFTFGPKQTCTGRVVGLQLLETIQGHGNSKCRGFCLHGLFPGCPCFGHLLNSRILEKPFTPWFHCLSLPSKHQRQHLWSHQKCRINNAGV